MHGSFYDQIFKTHPKNFAKTSLILKNPKISKNPINLGLMHEMNEEWRI